MSEKEDSNNRNNRPARAGFIAYRLKVEPDDFQVREISDIPDTIISAEKSRSGKEKSLQRLYLLEKTGWNTVDLLALIARRNHIRYDDLRYGGKKDRHAHTYQYVTSEDDRDLTCSDDKWSFRFIGKTPSLMGPDKILGNEFRITLRSMHEREIPVLKRNIERISRDGFPNYFDEQRFGGRDRDLGLPGVHLFRGDSQKALLTALTGIHSGEKRHARERKLKLRELWGNWKACERESNTRSEKKVFQLLLKRKDRWEEALSLLPGEDLSMMFSAFQSLVWNEMIGRLMEKSLNKEAAMVSTRAGELVFPRKEGAFQAMANYGDIPVPGPDAQYASEEVMDVYSEVLRSLGIEKNPGEKKIGRAFFAGHDRNPIIVPEFSGNPEIDDDPFYKNRKRVAITFRLPPGSYATMLIKNITLAGT